MAYQFDRSDDYTMTAALGDLSRAVAMIADAHALVSRAQEKLEDERFRGVAYQLENLPLELADLIGDHIKADRVD
jgi:hypothetical protein